MTSVAVVGGGITGLAAAWELVRAGAEVEVLEASGRLGGCIRTEDLRGRAVDLGPDAFVARVPEAVELCAQLGLDARLVAPAADAAAVWVGGAARPIPKGTVLGVPRDRAALVALVRNGLLSPAGAARALLDLVLPRRPLGADPSVGDLVRRRFGDQLQERVVDPLVGGIHAGSSDRLSAVAVAPQLAAAARSRHSLMRGLAVTSPPAAGAGGPAAATGPAGDTAGAGPLFLGLHGGMETLISALSTALREAGATISLGRAVPAAPVPGADATVVATPAAVAADLVEGVAPAAAADLRRITVASVVLSVLAYPAGAFRSPLEGAGLLVPHGEGRLVTACSFGSSKWPHWAGEGEVVLRVSAGRAGDERAARLDDAALVERLHAELEELVGVGGAPLEWRVARWPGAFPQYRPGHEARVARIDEVLRRRAPGVMVAGASYAGVGIPACIASGRAAARRALGAAGGSTSFS